MNESIDIEAFAGLMAKLDDPFADRAAVLAGANLDERSGEELAAAWSARLRDTSSGELAERFAAAYARARETLAKGQRAPSLPKATPEPPTRPAALESSPGLRSPGFAETADISAFVPRAGLPFMTHRAASPNPPIETRAEASRPKVGTGTEPLDPRALIPQKPLPFQAPPAPPAEPPRIAQTPPAAPPATAPGRRFIRFDAQTGEPLREPYWSDAPAGANEPAPDKIKK